MAGYWGIRTSKEKHDLIGDWLDKGVLRQGWGAHDLRDIGRRASAGQLDEEGRSVWKYTQAIVVPVKSWRGAVDRHHLDHGLAQLERGISAQGGADLAVLLTLADELPPDADKTIALAEQRTGVSTRVLLREETLDLLLERLGSIQL